MMALLSGLGLRGVIAVFATLAVAALAIRVDVVTSARDAARAELSSVRLDLAIAQAHADAIQQDRATAVAALEAERSRAVAAERQASSLRARIARDAGTDRDGITAPVLRDAIEGLQRTATRQDELFLGRMPAPYRLVVIVDGKTHRTQEVRGFKACRDLASAAAVELAKKPELVAHVRRASIRCDAVTYGDRT